MTYEGFAHIMGLGLAGAKVVFIEQEIESTQTEVPDRPFDSVEVLENAGPGLVSVKAMYRAPQDVEVHYCAILDPADNLLSLAQMPGGAIHLSTDEHLTSTLSYRLRNNSSPRFDFD